MWRKLTRTTLAVFLDRCSDRDRGVRRIIEPGT